MTSVIGIDPGMKGALCLLRPDGLLEIADVPVLRFNGKNRVDHASLAHTLDNWSECAPTVWIEDVSGRAGEGVTTAFGFGKTCGILIGLCAAHFMPIYTVSPAVWKKHFKLGKDKDQSRHEAERRWPRQAPMFALKKHDGRAEAALLALYGRLHGGEAA